MTIFAMVSTKDSLEYTELAIESFFKETNLEDNSKFILIDNDGSIKQSNLPHKEKIELIVNKVPLGFSANANQSIDQALVSNSDLYFLNNDVIFTKNWYEILKACPSNIVCTPLCNREVEYVASVSNVRKNSIVTALHCAPPPFSLNHYMGKSAHLNAIVEAHQIAVKGLFPVLHVPFFCVKIPSFVLKVVGKFDEEYGQGGGEDFDYCLRCYLADCSIAYAASSFMLHFGGKSTYESESEKNRQALRESHFRKVFLNKWGQELYDLTMNEDASILDRRPELKAMMDQNKISDFVKTLVGSREVKIHL
ncbi:MAG: hypothetical protein KDD56_06030 [Bdellovibrionales bacterium]|nr:hypothetical protein [Bdellovibrionales bacterium]